MAYPGSVSANIDNILTTTLENRSGVLADNVSENLIGWRAVKEAGGMRALDGGRQIYQELEYAENGTVMWYSGGEPIDTTPQEVFSAAVFDWKQLAGSIQMTGLEELQNSGEEQLIDLMEAKVKNLERSLMNEASVGFFSAGTGSGGKQMGGLQLLVADAPGTGTVGGIDRSTWSFYRNFYYRGVSDGGAAVSAANIKKYLNHMINKTTRDTDRPKLGIAGNTYFEFLQEACQAMQIVSDPKLVEAGFQTFKFAGINIVNGEGANGACSSTRFYLLNPDFIKIAYHKNRNFKVIGGERSPYNQDVVVKIVTWAGNMTCSNPSLQAVLIA